MARENVGLTRARLEEAEVADLLDLGVIAQEFTDLGGILTRPVHAKLERFEAAEQHPRRVRVANRADRIPKAAYLVDQPLLADERARHEIAVPADIFGQAVDREVGAVA